MPYILMNFQGAFHDTMTLAHEAGHSMHSYMSHKHQPYQYSSYPIFVAEVASTFNEELLFHKLLSQDLKKEERAMRPYNGVDTSGWVDYTADEFEKCLEVIIELAELQTSLEILGHEINRTKRIVNALEYMIIPSLEATIKFLSILDPQDL